VVKTAAADRSSGDSEDLPEIVSLTLFSSRLAALPDEPESPREASPSFPVDDQPKCAVA
jgi:hypothetical protein